ncbi:hypothetical protein PIIN_07608 [Serendipita indica DSM 11827]|uniref:Uncharacterized protein n=1 Tax=Serendipita indica (strain DSM 11827) TaxID=1109443 RepID=G4TQR2_SERID|nr:hypothetical protein PIIN_07608 [Serendipita indica DSM 11827]
MEDLSGTLQSLTSCIELAMKSLYDLQTATINANGENNPRHAERYKRVRAELRAHWEHITSLLNKCRSFGADVHLLHASVTTASKDDIRELLEEMLAKCRQDVDIAEQLMARHDNVLGLYAQYRDRFRDHLDHPKVQVTPPGRIRGSPSHAARSSRRQSTGPTGPPQSTPLGPIASFVEDSIASLYPDGNQAMAEFESAMEGIHASLSRLSRFLKDQIFVCQRGLDSLYHPSHNLTPRQFQEFTDSWVTYQGALMKAIQDITRICDAVMIDAVGAPRRPPSPPEEEELSPWEVIRSTVPRFARVRRRSVETTGYRHDSHSGKTEIGITSRTPHSEN